MQDKDIIVGNYEARKRLKKNILNVTPTLLYGPNGVGKTSVVIQLAEFLGLRLRHIFPLEINEIVKEFGVGPTDASNNEIYVIEADGLNAKKFSTIKNYVNNLKRPLILITQKLEKLNKKLVKLLDTIEFSPPSTEDVKKFLKTKFDWDGKIEDIYDPDMRIVLSRINTGEMLRKPLNAKTVSAKDLAVEIGFGYVKKENFEKLEQPLWWVMRWAAFNQRLKFPKNPMTMLKNLAKISFIDEYKFKGVEDYLHYMLMDLQGSPRRSFFKFPIWPKKEEVEESFEKIHEPIEIPKKKKFDLSHWL